MMHIMIALMVLVAGVYAVSTAAKAQHCETIECYTADCWWVGPGHRRCRRVCRRRCWHPPPRYEPPAFRIEKATPEPEPHRFAVEPPRASAVTKPKPPPVATRYEQPPLRIPAEIIGAGIIAAGLIVLFSLIVHACRVARLRRDIRIRTRRVRSAEHLKQRMAALSREADEYIAAARAEAYRRGTTT